MKDYEHEFGKYRWSINTTGHLFAFFGDWFAENTPGIELCEGDIYRSTGVDLRQEDKPDKLVLDALAWKEERWPILISTPHWKTSANETSSDGSY